ncbi:14260_t:CDS:2 [Gigaspora rosea]|nr:14260_t:CDS:2 [Gigaspora rosea]
MTFTTCGIVNLQHPHAFIVNGRAYHQIHSANTEGYPINWFVYDADARNNIISQRGLNQNIVNRIEQELEAINLFIQGLYQLRDVNYPQARLIIQQPTANAEIAACTIVHSTAIMQERCVQIWRWRMYWIDIENSSTRKFSQIDYYRYRIMTESRFHLLGRLFNEYLVDMFSRADDERLQFIRKKQYRFQKGGQEEDESLGDEAELHLENIYLPAYAENRTNQYTLPSNTYLEEECIGCRRYAARALGLLDDTNEYEQCFAEAVSYNCTPGQLHLLFCHLILEGVNESLVWIATFLEEHGYNITQRGLPQPHGCLSEIIRIKQQYSNYNELTIEKEKMNVLNNPTACLQRAILCPLNVEVNFINDTILQQLEGDKTNLYSVDNLADDESINTLESQRYQRNMVTTELLNSFNAPGIPKHCLTKTRVIVTNIGHRLITIKNPTTNCIVHLPRITFQFCISHFPFKINCRQFSLRLAYSSTFNSSQGLTLDKVTLNLRTPVFSHSQLYTALTQVRERNHIKIFTEESYSPGSFNTKNIVYSELIE